MTDTEAKKFYKQVVEWWAEDRLQYSHGCIWEDWPESNGPPAFDCIKVYTFRRRPDIVLPPDDILVRVSDTGVIDKVIGPGETVDTCIGYRLFRYIRSGKIIKAEDIQYRLCNESAWKDCQLRSDIEYRLKP